VVLVFGFKFSIEPLVDEVLAIILFGLENEALLCDLWLEGTLTQLMLSFDLAEHLQLFLLASPLGELLEIDVFPDLFLAVLCKAISHTHIPL